MEEINEATSRKTGRSSVKVLSLNGVCITNSTALSNPFNEQISLTNGPGFQEHISDLSERFKFVPTDCNQVLSLLKKKMNKFKGASLLGIFFNGLI